MDHPLIKDARKKIKKDKMTMIRQRYQLIVVVVDATYSWRLSPSKKSKKNWLFLSSDIVDRRILQSDWMRGTHGQNEPKVLVPDANFLCWIARCRKIKVSHLTLSRDIVDQRNMHSEIWLDDSRNWPVVAILVSDPTFPWWLSTFKIIEGIY